jgi:hypothetical protein
MGRSGTILGIIGLILGAGGLGLGGYAWISVSRVENQVSDFSEQSTWFRYNETNLDCIPFNPVTFSGLTIEFNLGMNESVYFSFMAQAHLEPDSGWSQITVYFRVDDLIDSDHYATVGLYNGGYATLMITLQHKRYDLSLGMHNVTVVIVGNKLGNYIYRSSLFVQKFPT